MKRTRKKKNGLNKILMAATTIALAFAAFQIYNRGLVGAPAGAASGGTAVDTSVMQLIRLQNETITALKSRLEASDAHYRALVESEAGRGKAQQQLELAFAQLDRKDGELRALKAQTMASETATAAPPLSPAATPWQNHSGPLPAFRVVRSGLDEECDARFGLGLSERWRATREAWCAMPSGGGERGGASKLESSIHCYPYRQAHKRSGPRAQVDLFCEGTNIFVDFGKVSGRHGKTKPTLGAQYLSFGGGATFATCAQTRKWDASKLMPHMARQLGKGQFHFGRPPPPEGSFRVEKGWTYLLARDEDCENMFHSSADHINLFNVAQILGLDFSELQVTLWDKHFDGPFYDLIQTAFSPAKPIKRIGDYGGGIVKFEKVVWHLESPAGIVFPKVGGPSGLMRCHHSSLWMSFKQHVLQSFNLHDTKPPPVPTVLLSFRRRTDAKNVGRVFQNENDLRDVLGEGNMIRVEAADLGGLPFRKQLELVRRSNILVGAHGAGLMHVLFMSEEGVLVEIHPSYRLDRHFRLASRMAGKIYLPMRSTDPVTCRGSSDAIPVNKEEFRRVMDAAVRLARSFDDGASECGLRCDPRILALDKGNDPWYKETATKKGVALNTKFPCH